MKKILFFVLVGLAQWGYGQDGLLWKIEKQGKAHYLYALTDFMRKDVFVFGDSVMPALRGADFYVPQIELSDENLNAIAQALFLPNKKTLRDTLKSDDFLLLKEKVVQNLHGAWEDYQSYQVFALAKSVDFARSKPDSKTSLADHFRTVAERMGKESLGLETVADQLHYNLMLPIDGQVAYFRELGQADTVLHQRLRAYIGGNIGLYYQLSIGNDAWTGHRRAILAERNHILAERLKKAMQSGKIFATLDAETMGGENGVLKLLEQAGYKVTAVKQQGAVVARFVETQEWKREIGFAEFYISFPNKFESESQTIQSELGPLQATTLRCIASDGDPNIYYSLTYTDYPAHIIHSDFQEMWDDIFNNSGDAVMEALEGTLVEESSVTLSNFPGRETLAEFDNGQKAAKFRTYLVRNRLYIIQVVGNRDRILNPSTGKFLDSFQLK